MSERWFQVLPPDNHMSIRVEAVNYVQKDGAGCVVVTSDGTRNTFTAVSYETMCQKLGIPAPTEEPK